MAHKPHLEIKRSGGADTTSTRTCVWEYDPDVPGWPIADTTTGASKWVEAMEEMTWPSVQVFRSMMTCARSDA